MSEQETMERLAPGIVGHFEWRKALKTDAILRRMATEARKHPGAIDVRLVAEWIAAEGQNGRGCFASTDRIAEFVGCDRHVIGRMRKTLIELGWFTLAADSNKRHVVVNISLPVGVGTLRDANVDWTQAEDVGTLRDANVVGTDSETLAPYRVPLPDNAIPDKAPSRALSSSASLTFGTKADSRSESSSKGLSGSGTGTVPPFEELTEDERAEVLAELEEMDRIEAEAREAEELAEFARPTGSTFLDQFSADELAESRARFAADQAERERAKLAREQAAAERERAAAERERARQLRPDEDPWAAVGYPAEPAASGPEIAPEPSAAAAGHEDQDQADAWTPGTPEGWTPLDDDEDSQPYGDDEESACGLCGKPTKNGDVVHDRCSENEMKKALAG